MSFALIMNLYEPLPLIVPVPLNCAAREQRGSGAQPLNQTLYAIRQQLGEDVVVGTTTLRLNPERVRCDLWEYRDALRRGDVAAAVRLREGELLENVYAP